MEPIDPFLRQWGAAATSAEPISFYALVGRARRARRMERAFGCTKRIVPQCGCKSSPDPADRSTLLLCAVSHALGIGPRSTTGRHGVAWRLALIAHGKVRTARVGAADRR